VVETVRRISGVEIEESFPFLVEEDLDLCLVLRFVSYSPSIFLNNKSIIFFNASLDDLACVYRV
jgi:hypothetical protein